MSPPRIEEASAAPSVDVASLLWPGEHPRFVLAATVAIASALFLVGILLVEGVVRFLIIALTLGAAVGSVWWVLQIGKARLLGSSIKVTSTSFPDLQAVIDDVRRQLDYHRRIDVYVVAKSDPAVNLISYLGTRVIIIEGGLAEELSEPARQAQLCFLIARHIGALKARHARVDALVVLLSAANALPYAKPFLLPYYRATTYSGDQIGLTCCGSLDAALEATGRLLVGKELAADLPMGGVLTQASMIQKRWLPRLAQFTSPSPHVVNRYLNLLMYGRRLNPESWDRVRASLAPKEAGQFDALWTSSPQSRQPRATSVAGRPAFVTAADLAQAPPPSFADEGSLEGSAATDGSPAAPWLNYPPPTPRRPGTLA